MKRTVYWIRIVCVCILVLGMLGCSGSCAANNYIPSYPKPYIKPTQNNGNETVTPGVDEVGSTIPDNETNAAQTPDASAEPATPEATEEPDIEIPVTLKPGETRNPTPTPKPTPSPDENVTPSPTPDTSDIELPEV
ncbi:MAG: hypothetical protein II412_00185 [Clostridia bacterium]|nr:hypothetical protein [Clostridia bacterium]